MMVYIPDGVNHRWDSSPIYVRPSTPPGPEPEPEWSLQVNHGVNVIITANPADIPNVQLIVGVWAEMVQVIQQPPNFVGNQMTMAWSLFQTAFNAGQSPIDVQWVDWGGNPTSIGTVSEA